jgi:four helix bundle protein
MSDNPVLTKSFAFALRIIKLCKYLSEEKREYVLSKELMVAGTHIGKHIKEAVSAESRQVFINEFGVARRKASETEYWLQLLLFSNLLKENEYESIEADRQELIKLITSIFNKSKQNA